MKRLFLIFAVCVIILYSATIAYANEQFKVVNIAEDLPLVQKFETAEVQKTINSLGNEVQSILSEQRLNINTLSSIYYLGYYQGGFDSVSLKRCLDWNKSLSENAPLFKSDIYKDYYKLRTEKLLKQYQSTEAFDYQIFQKSARLEYNSYIKAAIKNQNHREQLIVLLQEKLADKLVELDAAKRKALTEELLAIRLTPSSNLSNDYIFQMFESRVRLQLFTEMAVMNQQKLQKLTKDIKLAVTSSREGQLTLQNASQNGGKPVRVLNLLNEGEGFRGQILLSDLYDKAGSKLTFAAGENEVIEIEASWALSGIVMDSQGFVYLDLDSLMEQPKESKAPANAAAPSKDEGLKALEALYASKSKAAQGIIKELNRYSIYLELKDNKISNSFTKNFEKDQPLWKKNMDSMLSSFGTAGMADFYVYMKQFALLDRKPVKQDLEKALLARFRNSDIQFRKIEECSLWITDMLFRIKNMK